MKLHDIEFSDEVEIKGVTYEVDIEASGYIDKDQNANNVKLDRIYSQEHRKFFDAKNLSFKDMKRIMEKASDQLVEQSVNDFNPAEFADDNLYEEESFEDLKKYIR